MRSGCLQSPTDGSPGQRSRKEFLRKQRIPSFSSFFNFHRHVTPVDSEIVGKLLALQRNLKGRGTAQLCLSGEVGKQLFSDGSFSTSDLPSGL